MNFTDAFISSSEVAKPSGRYIYKNYIVEKLAFVKLTLDKLFAGYSLPVCMC